MWTLESKNEKGRSVYPGRKKLLGDAEAMKITNFDEANEFVKREYRPGWSWKCNQIIIERCSSINIKRINYLKQFT